MSKLLQVKTGKIEESQSALQCLEGKKTNISQEIADIKVISLF